MSERPGGVESKLLVTTDDQPFGSAVVDAVEQTGMAASAEHVEPVTGNLTHHGLDSVEGAIVDGKIAEPAAVVERLTEEANLPVIVLADSTGDDDTIDSVINAGAADIFPRTTTSKQCILAVERLLTDDSPESAQPLAGEETTYRQAYKALFEKIPEGIVVHDPETGEIVDVNERFCEMNGYERSELLGEPVDIVTASKEVHGPEAATEMIQRARTEGPQRFEWHNQRRNGETFPVEVDLTVVELGDAERVLAGVQDITERKRREREYEQIFNGVNDPIAVFDPDTGEITEVNEPYNDMIGYDDFETIRELGIGGLTATDEEYTGERGAELVREVSDTRDPMTVEWAAETASGDRRWLEVTLSPAVIRGEQRVLTIQRDVTERKRREQEFEQIFNGVEDAIAVFDPDTLEYLDANEAYLEMFDHESVSELRERGVSGLSITEEGYTKQRGREVHQRVAESGQPETLEWKGETSGGERVWLEVKVAPAVIGGEQRTISIQRDVTERKRREQRLEVFNRILRHNLRNQLDVIRSHAEELSDRTAGDHAAQIIDAGAQLAAIGRQARQIDRIMSRDETLIETDVVETVRETIEATEPMRDNVTVITEFPGKTRLWTDEETVALAVESALENALEYATSTVTVTIEARPDECVIAVVDDGPGIPEEALVPIEAGRETTFQHGTGLGLWQLRWSVDKLNGELSFETNDETTVRIAVPDRRGASRPD